jgi:hypothetical protein
MLLFDPTVKKDTALNRLQHVIEFTALDREREISGALLKERKKAGYFCGTHMR